MSRPTWKTIKLMQGYIILASQPVDTAPKRVHRELRERQEDVESRVTHNRDAYIVGTNPIRVNDKLLGWVVIAALAGRFETRMNNILAGLL